MPFRRVVIHTDARLKPIRLGKLDLRFKQTAQANFIGRDGQP